MEYGLVGLWLAAFLLLGAVSLPLAAWLFPDSNYEAYSIPLGLAVLGVVGHLVGHVRFGLPAALAGVLAILAASGLATRELDPESVADPIRVVESAGVFTAGFLLVVLIRGIDPVAAPLPLAAGEKLLDFGLLATLDRSQALPAESMWFAGEPVKYHYGGHVITSLVSALTGTVPAYAYNLGLAGFYGTLVLTAYGLAGSVASRYNVHDRLCAVLGAFFVGLAGNLETALRGLAWVLPDALTARLVDVGLFYETMPSWSPDQFYYWDASRVIPVDPTADRVREAATEFPMFAWLNGDLHAHMMSQPLMLLVGAVLLAAWQADTRRRGVLLAGVLPPLVGLIGFVNIWSFPSALGLTALAVFFAPWDPASILPVTPEVGTRQGVQGQLREEGRRLAVTVGVVVAVALGAVIWTLPYWLTAVVGGPGVSVDYWEPWTPILPLLIVHGGFLTGIVVYLARRLSTPKLGSGTVLLLGIGLLAVSAVLGAPALALTLPLIGACWWLFRQDIGLGFEGVLIVAGAGLVLLVELVTLETSQKERFNVIFKPYVHVWLFWGIAAAVAFPRLASGWTAVSLDVNRRRMKITGAVLAAVVVIGMGLYPAAALYNHVDNGTKTTDEVGHTLDATAYLEVQYPEEAPAIRWLNQETTGQPTIVTDAPGGYWWAYDRLNGNFGGASAPASLTGAPTVAGWFHEAQYRGDQAFDSRVSDVETIYTGEPDEQRALLAKYDVEYIYVGPVEQEKFTDIRVERLDGVSVAKAFEETIIYEVDQSELSP